MYAIVKTGGKQYMVEEGTELKVEKLDANIGDKVELEVVAVSNDGSLKLGDDIKSVKVTAEVLESGKDKKVIIFKYKPKKDYRNKRGHRQPFTKIKISSIVA